MLVLLADGVARDTVQGEVGGDAQQEGFGRSDAARLVGCDAEIGFLDKIFRGVGTKASPQPSAKPDAISSIESCERRFLR